MTPQPSVEVFAASLEGEPSEDDAALLSAGERVRAARFGTDRLRDRFVFRRAFLRRRLGEVLGQHPAAVVIEYGPHGKPAVAGAPLDFNLSHSGDLAVVAVARVPGVAVGVDVELAQARGPGAGAAGRRAAGRSDLDRLDLLVARRMFAAAELEQLLALPPAQQQAAFLRCWTRKEAVVKALGTGVDGTMRGFAVDLGPGPAADLHWLVEPPMGGRWALADVSAVAPGCRAALATASAGVDVRVEVHPLGDPDREAAPPDRSVGG